MANPNIVGVTSIYGKTAAALLTTTLADIVSNAASSGKIYKINSVYCSNIDGTNTPSVRVTFNNGTEYDLIQWAEIPPGSSLVVVSKDAAIYLEEGQKIRAAASAASDIHIVVSYEEIS